MTGGVFAALAQRVARHGPTTGNPNSRGVSTQRQTLGRNRVTPRFATALLSVILVGCSASVSTDLIPTTTTESIRVPAGDLVGVPRDSADAAAAVVILDLQAAFREFLVLYNQQPDAATIGGMIAAINDQLPAVNASLDRIEGLTTELQAFGERGDVSFRQSDMRDLIAALSTWVGGQRDQNDPSVACMDRFPPDAMSRPSDDVAEYLEFGACLVALISSDLVADTGLAGERVSSLMNTIYADIVEG